MNYKPTIGDTGTFYPAHFPIDDGYGVAKPPAVRATIERIWTDTCVNLRCENGVLPTSVLVVHPEAENKPSGYYFIPDALVHVVGEAAPAAPAADPKPMVYNFDEFVVYGRHAVGSCVNGMPWSFTFHGHPVTHENDNLYIISDTKSPGGSLHFHRGDALVVRGTEVQLIKQQLPEPAPELTVEEEIQVKGLTAPRVTMADIEANISSCHFFTADDGVASSTPYQPVPSALRLLTFCVLVLRNGFTVTGQSACASPENFDAEIGRRIAREDAIRQVWPLLGFELRTRIAEGRTTIADRTRR